MMDIETFVLNKARECDPDIELQDMYTENFMFGGRFVMDIIEEYIELIKQNN